MLKNNNKIDRYTTQSSGVWSKNRVKSLYFDKDYFDLEVFSASISSNLSYGVGYSILIKLKYNNGDYGMASKQIPFRMEASNKDVKISLLFNDINNLIDGFSERYRVEYIDIIQILYIVTVSIPQLKLTNINKITLNKEFTKVNETRVWFSSKSLPLTVNTNYFGELLNHEQATYYLSKINENYLLLNKDSIELSDISSMYLYDNQYIILNIVIDDKTILRKVFHALSCISYLEVKDVIVNNYSFTRTIGKTSFTISTNKVVALYSNKVLLPIKNRSKVYKASSNPYIGTLDLETYVDFDGYSKVYAIGIYTKLEADKNEPAITFFINKERDSSELVLKCLDLMLSGNYNNYTFYTHNLGGYDAVFLLKILTERNLVLGYDYYIINTLYRDNRILKLEIKVYPDTKYSFNKIVIVDSYNLLSDKLHTLSHSFGLDVVKGHFPHKFVNKNTFNYEGNIPSIEYWESIDNKEYKALHNNSWNLKKECLNYLDKDLISLYKIMDTFNKYVFTNYGVQMTDALTISRLALNIFLDKYLKESKIPVISQNMYNDIKKAYYGGLTEVYKPYGKNLYYYDVNSLYPYVALNSMPGIHCTYLESLDNSYLDLKELFGFFYCEIETKDSYLGLLPVHTNFELIMPNGKWEGWYFSEELKFAASQGYKIKPIKGYNFDKQENVFKEYVDTLYKTKSTTGFNSIRIMAKSLLNNLLGRFGININKPITEIINKDKLNLILSTREVSSVIDITDRDVLVTYNPTISKNICKANEIDYIKVLNINPHKDMEKNKEFKDVSIAIAAAVTAYARIYMSQIKLDIIKNGGNIYYTDTDSIVSDIPLNNNIVGNKLGQFKLVYFVKEGYFISSKTYCLVTNDSKKPIIKAKGVFSDTLTLIDFKKMFKGISVEADKKNTVTNYAKGSVVINKETVKLNFNSYKKRVKIYNNSKWVDTKPLYIDIDKNNTSMDNKKYSTYSKGSANINPKFSNSFRNLLNKYRNSIISLFILSSLAIILYFILPDIILMINNIYYEYVQYVHKVKGDHLKWVLENRFTSNSISSNEINPMDKISKFNKIEFNQKYKDYFTDDKLIILRAILNEVNINFQSLVNTINNTPVITQTNLTDFLFEARDVHAQAPINPLGIQGINHNLDEVIHMLDEYIVEHRSQSLERLNYHSNIMYILVNKLSPSIY